MFKKIIIQGSLRFGKERSYDKAFKMYSHRLEVYYKTGLLFDEEFFDKEEFRLVLPRQVGQFTEKQYKNTTDLLMYLAQFAVSGSIGAWMLDEGVLKAHHMIEPQSDKIAVQSYLEGLQLSGEEGAEEQALDALTKAIAKHDKHSQAYERRGFVNIRLGNVEDSIYDFTKAIKLDEFNAVAYLGRARVLISQGHLENALVDLDQATKKSIALQSTYWTARRLKAECYLELGDLPNAEFELKLFTKRVFQPGDPNVMWKKWAYYEYGNLLLQLQRYDEALIAHNKALEIDEGHGKVEKSAQLTGRGIARQRAGGSGYIADWKEAAHLGSEQAQKLLEEHV
jgi:tetratricopeptide (TPR) repeat protein